MLRRRWFPAVAGAGALATALLTAKGRGRSFDDGLYRNLNRGRGPRADAFFKGITELGSILASAGAATAIAASGRRRQALDALGAAGAMWVVGQAAKRSVLRPRPYHALPGVRLLIGEPRGTTWPSSHPAVLLSFLTVAARDLDASRTMKAALAGVALLVGWSRIYLGVHYPADVAGGLLLGRGVADLWSALMSPWIVGRLPTQEVPDTVSA
jgi:membrane-associated phospholipid phosphatase